MIHAPSAATARLSSPASCQHAPVVEPVSDSVANLNVAHSTRQPWDGPARSKEIGTGSDTDYQFADCSAACSDDDSSAAPAVRTAFLVAFEGLPSSGKTTAIRAVRAWLMSRGIRVAVVDSSTSPEGRPILAFGKLFPSGHPCRLLLMWAARVLQGRWIWINRFRYDVIIADRYVGSLVAYDEFGNHVPQAVSQWVQGKVQPLPDLTLCLQTSVEVAARRYRAATFADPVFAYRIAAGYAVLSNQDSWISVDAERSPQLVAEECIDRIASCLEMYEQTFTVDLPPLSEFEVQEVAI